MFMQILLVTFLVLVSAEGQKIWSPLQSIPGTDGIGWPPKQPWNHKVQEWLWVHVENLKWSVYNATPGPANTYGRVVGAIIRTYPLFTDCVYDAWVAASCTNDKPTTGINLNTKKRQFSEKEIVEAVSYAAYTSLWENFHFLGEARQKIINDTLKNQGYSLSLVTNTNTNTPSGLGVKACKLVIQHRYDTDETNHNGTHPQSNVFGERYSDYTNYQPHNPGMPELGKTNCDTLRFIDSWEPVRHRTIPGQNLTAVKYWGDVVFANKKPLFMPCKDSFRPQMIPKSKGPSYDKWILRNQRMIDYSYQLNDTTKALASYFQASEGYIGIMWVKHCAIASIKLKLNLENTIKLHFVIAHTNLESNLVQYEGKRFNNAPRPTTVVQCVFRDKNVPAWKGPYQGIGIINGSNWSAYLPDTVVNNWNPEYPCGHCTQAGAVAVGFQRYFGSDKYIGENVTYQPGTFPPEPKLTPEYVNYKAGVTDVPNTGPATVGYAPAKPVTLHFKTWTEATTQCGVSRIYLGVHYEDSHQISYPVGVKVGKFVVDYIEKNYFKMPRLLAPKSYDSAEAPSD